MIICVVVDDNMGMTFNHRRQSKDKTLRKYILQMVNHQKLWMNTYTAKQFGTSLTDNVIIDDDFLEKAGDDDFCFVENVSLLDYQERVHTVFLFKWNRVYPADTYFDMMLSEPDWHCASISEFEGNSHEKITREEWHRDYEK